MQVQLRLGGFIHSGFGSYCIPTKLSVRKIEIAQKYFVFLVFAKILTGEGGFRFDFDCQELPLLVFVDIIIYKIVSKCGAKI